MTTLVLNISKRVIRVPIWGTYCWRAGYLCHHAWRAWGSRHGRVRVYWLAVVTCPLWARRVHWLAWLTSVLLHLVLWRIW